MTSILPNACGSCIHLHTTDTMGNSKCDAFPKGIPSEIVFDGDPHTDPFPGDNGIQYELAPGRERRKQAFDRRREAGL